MHRMVVLAKAVAGRSEELARWYDDRHMHDLLAVPGFTSAERHAVIPVKCPDGSPAWDFMLIYEIAGEEPFAVLKRMAGFMGTERMPTSDALESTATVSLIGLTKKKLGNHE